LDSKNIKQRTKEWFELREGVVSGSKIGALLGKNKYTNILDFVLQEAAKEKEYTSSTATQHGKNFEQMATLIYENITGTKVEEVGFIKHKHHNFLGASPDGFIVEKMRLIEIKCPVRRQINSCSLNNDILEICPEYYYEQIQM